MNIILSHWWLYRLLVQVGQGYIFLQIPYFLGRETIQLKLKLGKKFRREQWKCVHENGEEVKQCGKIGREEIDTFWNIYSWSW